MPPCCKSARPLPLWPLPRTEVPIMIICSLTGGGGEGGKGEESGPVRRACLPSFHHTLLTSWTKSPLPLLPPHTPTHC